MQQDEDWKGRRTELAGGDGDRAPGCRTGGERLDPLAASGSPWALRRREARGLRRGVVTSRWRRPWLAQGPRLQSVNYAGLAPAAE